MVKEIYIRTPNDPYYEAGIVDYSNEVESIISQVRMLLGTKPGDVLGDPHFGIEIEDLVYGTKTSGLNIKKKLDEKISSYIHPSPGISLNTEINFGHTDKGSDYALIDISINGKKSVGFLVGKDN